MTGVQTCALPISENPDFEGDRKLRKQSRPLLVTRLADVSVYLLKMSFFLPLFSFFYMNVMTKGAGLLPTPFYFPVNLATIACQVSGFKMLIGSLPSPKTA